MSLPESYGVIYVSPVWMFFKHWPDYAFDPGLVDSLQVFRFIKMQFDPHLRV